MTSSLSRSKNVSCRLIEKTGRCIASGLSRRYSSQFVTHISMIFCAGFGRGHSDTPNGSRCMASRRDWILRDRSRRPRSLRTAEGRSLVGVTHVHRCAVTSGARRLRKRKRSPSCSTIVGPASRNIRGGRVVADLSDYVDVANEEVAQAVPQVESAAPTERSRLKPRTEAVQSAYGRSTSIRAIRSLATSVRSGSCRRARRIIPGRQRP